MTFSPPKNACFVAFNSYQNHNRQSVQAGINEQKKPNILTFMDFMFVLPVFHFKQNRFQLLVFTGLNSGIISKAGWSTVA